MVQGWRACGCSALRDPSRPHKHAKVKTVQQLSRLALFLRLLLAIVGYNQVRQLL